jgi:multiple sugar transport system substrate-binding protein
VIDMKDVTDEANKRWGTQLELCKKSSMNPTTGKFFAYAPGWVPDPGNYRKSLWEPVGFGNGPDLLGGPAQGRRGDQEEQGRPDGPGHVAGDRLEHGDPGAHVVQRRLRAGRQRADRVELDATVASVDFMARLFKDTMTNEVFSWNAASNNQGLVAGKLSYIVNSISAYRTAQGTNPEVSDDTFFVPALKGTQAALAAQHVMYNWISPKHAKNVDAAKEFLLHYTRTSRWPRTTRSSTTSAPGTSSRRT